MQTAQGNQFNSRAASFCVPAVEEGNVGMARFGFGGKLDHAGRIAGEIADRRIELGQGYLHREESGY
ncbi:MAG: hypothetical protein ACYDCD_00730 [Candidatus Acidiferrales bacterium]